MSFKWHYDLDTIIKKCQRYQACSTNIVVMLIGNRIIIHYHNYTLNLFIHGYIHTVIITYTIQSSSLDIITFISMLVKFQHHFHPYLLLTTMIRCSTRRCKCRSIINTRQLSPYILQLVKTRLNYSFFFPHHLIPSLDLLFQCDNRIPLFSP